MVDPRVGRLVEGGWGQQADRLTRFLSLRSLGLPSAMLLAGRLAPGLGGRRLGRALVLRAAQRVPSSPEARCHAARVVLEMHGPTVTWLRLREGGAELDSAASAEVQAIWLTLHARVAGCFRDFGSASTFLRAADELAPALPDVALARADVLVEQDRRPEALEAAREALRRMPGHVRATLTTADLLLTQGRGEAACDLLLEAATVTEDSRVLQGLAVHLAEQRRFRECLEWLDRFEIASPLLDRDGRCFLAGMRSSAVARVGAIQTGPTPGPGGAGEPCRVLLPVPFVAQDRFTCSPATLTALAAYWQRALDQGAVADEICYQGTLRHRARAWAEAHGFEVREFRVTWDSARAVLDQGIPFALVTKWGMAGHDQAVVGYDEARSSLLIRCPSRAFLVEVPQQWFFATQAWCGPRGTILVPTSETSSLDDLALPDTEAYDYLYALEVALGEHRRDDAGEIAARLARRAPRSRLGLWATIELARYDSDHATVLRCAEAMLQAFPATPALELWRLSALRHLVSPDVYLRMLAATCRRHPRDPALQSLLALQLSTDSRVAWRASSVLRPVLRLGHWPTGWLNLLTLANIRAAGGRPEEAEALVELAARLDDMQEWLAMTYFNDARARGRADEALSFLRARYEAYGRLSGDPAQTLFEALRLAGDHEGALRLLAEARTLRPWDDDLKLFAARAHATAGHRERADALLGETRGRTHRTQWLRTAAAVASGRGDHAASLERWREVLALEPAAVDAHQAVASLLTQLGRPSAANAHLRAVRNRFPHHHALAQLRHPRAR